MVSTSGVAADPSHERFQHKFRKPTVILADDHEQILQRASRLLDPYFDVIASVNNGRDAVKEMKQKAPDLVVLDIGMPLLDGIETAQEMRRLGYEGRIAFLTVQEEPLFVNAAVDAGASAYILKKSMVTELVPALERMMAGETYFSPALKKSSTLR